ncbi:hypothetical protein XA68_12908 [Ophiocordyceps unilateralis]|uniref:Uncharacterized protein n=1 Tax=Ophiocordyceps unilateralis TaxID=268505 RepID=A0A2A9PCK9_OPHUN|nr:hypothetical protein XA68_12908 [Ophiocordyceps unilateralis]
MASSPVMTDHHPLFSTEAIDAPTLRHPCALPVSCFACETGLAPRSLSSLATRHVRLLHTRGSGWKRAGVDA